ncbi:MAG: ERCC4 domain-containing protein [Candidatus Aenigmarchaeota archaeon]
MAKVQKILDTGKIRIVVDHRESKNHVFRNLKEFDADLIRKQLKTGDYICSDRVCVERKTIPDFIQSIIDQRIFKQVSEISECFEKPLMILEGNPDLLFMERNVHPNTIRGALASLAIDYKIPIIWTRNSLETANQIYWIAYREQVKEKRGMAIRCPRKLTSISNQQEFLIAGLPHVNTKLSKSLLKKFKTPKKVFSAKPEKLMKVEKIGKGKAKKIWELLNARYE